MTPNDIHAKWGSGDSQEKKDTLHSNAWAALSSPSANELRAHLRKTEMTMRLREPLCSAPDKQRTSSRAWLSRFRYLQIGPYVIFARFGHEAGSCIDSKTRRDHGTAQRFRAVFESDR